ncbi:hypothetical protein FACS1894106_2170 [Spirochaetia bacterium]|nr:hypothetical protein FACS1894106_2170 [Spirochaetia bacterium]
MQVIIQVHLHLLNGFVELNPALNPEMFIQQCPVEPFNNTITLRPADLGSPVFDVFKLEE